MSHQLEEDPKTFACKENSPVSTPVWSPSKVYPSVALTHIFCGQITSSGKAEGFHSRPGGKDPESARTVKHSAHIAGLDCYEGEDVYNANTKKWVSKKAQDRFCFFPADWSIADTVKNIQTVFNRCSNKISDDRICGRNYNNKHFDIIIYVTRNDIGTHPGKYRVVSSFATSNNKVKCKVTCNLEKKLKELNNEL